MLSVMASADEEWLLMRHRAYTVPHAAALLDTSRNQLWQLIKAGQVPAFRLGNRWKIPGEWLVDTLRQGKDSQ